MPSGQQMYWAYSPDPTICIGPAYSRTFKQIGHPDYHSIVDILLITVNLRRHRIVLNTFNETRNKQTTHKRNKPLSAAANLSCSFASCQCTNDRKTIKIINTIHKVHYAAFSLLLCSMLKHNAYTIILRERTIHNRSRRKQVFPGNR